MKTALVIFLLAVAAAAPCLAYTTGEREKKDIGVDSLKQSPHFIEMLGKILQEKNATITFRAELAHLARELEALHGIEKQLDENTSEYFFKKIRRVVENVAKAVVVNKAVGAIGGMIG